VLPKEFVPLKVLLLASKVEEAAVMVAEPFAGIVVPLTVARVPVRRVVPMVVVETTWPWALVPRSAFVMPVKTRFVVVAVPLTVRPPWVVPLPMVELAKAVRPPLNWVRVEVALPVRAKG